jgi:hypothetical protein
MKNWIFLTGLALMFFTSCQKDSGMLELSAPTCQSFTQDNTESPDSRSSFKQVYLGQPVTLMVNESAIILPDGITVTFKDVTEDSRCPTGYNCFWEGRAVLAFSFEKYDDYLAAGLATPNNLSLPPTEMTVFNRKVKLLEVAPYPMGSRPVPIEKYRAAIVVERTGGGEEF